MYLKKSTRRRRRGGAASLYALESRQFGTRTNPGKLAAVKSFFIRITRGFSPAYCWAQFRLSVSSSDSVGN